MKKEKELCIHMIKNKENAFDSFEVRCYIEISKNSYKEM